MNPRLDFRRRSSDAGFTVVEFMVAVAIGMIVSMVIGQIFVGSRQSFSSQEDSARMQEALRNASLILTRTIRMSGYRNNPAIDQATVFPKATTPAIDGADNVTTSGLPSQTTDATKPTASSPATVPDTITVRYQGSGSGTAADGSVVNCMGTGIDFGAMALNTFAVRPVTKVNGGVSITSSSLFCSTDGGATWPAANELIPDVDNMQILYGVDTDSDGAANAFVRRSDVSDIDTIVSVRIWLLMRSPTPSFPTVQAATYTLAGVNYSYNDRFARRVMYTTINLRNRTL